MAVLDRFARARCRIRSVGSELFACAIVDA
jgi:hypothetical protein